MADDNDSEYVNQTITTTDTSELIEITRSSMPNVEIVNRGDAILWWKIGTAAPAAFAQGAKKARPLLPGTSVTWPISTGQVSRSVFVRVNGTTGTPYSVGLVPAS